MEFSLKSIDSAIPCEVTADEDNGRYMVRKADTSGEVFNTAAELLQWIEQNWNPEDFEHPSVYHRMLNQLRRYAENE